MIQVAIFATVFATVFAFWGRFFRWVGPRTPINSIDYERCMELAGIVSGVIAVDPQIKKKFTELVESAPNFVCLKYAGDLEIRLRRVHGKTEAELLEECRAQIESLEQKLEECEHQMNTTKGHQ